MIAYLTLTASLMLAAVIGLSLAHWLDNDSFPPLAGP